jgi:hypothetical protein
MNATRVFAGANSNGPQRRTSSTNLLKSTRARGPLPLRNLSTEYWPQEWYMFLFASFTPHFGQIHSDAFIYLIYFI